MKDKALYDSRKEQGICVQCGKRPAAEGHVRCEECTEKQKASWQKSYRAHGKSEKAVADNREYAKRRYHRRIENGICGICGQRPLAPGYKCYCAECAEKNKQRMRARGLQGIPLELRGSKRMTLGEILQAGGKDST